MGRLGFPCAPASILTVGAVLPGPHSLNSEHHHMDLTAAGQLEAAPAPEEGSPWAWHMAGAGKMFVELN